MIRMASFLLAILLPYPVYAETTIFSDGFDRLDGVVGNGWSKYSNNSPADLSLKDGVLTNLNNNGIAGIYRSIESAGTLNIQFDLTEKSGFFGKGSQFSAQVLFDSGPSFQTGYGLHFIRTGQEFFDSRVMLQKGQDVIAILNSSYQYQDKILVNFDLTPTGKFTGRVSDFYDSSRFFDFSFDQAEGQFSPRTIGLVMEGADGRIVSDVIAPRLDNLVLTERTVAPPPPAPPSLLELAQLSGQSYYPEVQKFGRFSNPLDSIADGPFFGSVFADGNEVVVAFRGSEIGATAEALKTWGFVNTTFASGEPSFSFVQYLDNAVDFLNQVYLDFPGANITLTGHSLGGAVANILSAATGIKSVSFNSPNIGEILNNVGYILDDLFAHSEIAVANSTAYRLLGDFVSLVGPESAYTKTLVPANRPTDLSTLSNILYSHEIDNMIIALLGPYDTVDGELCPPCYNADLFVDAVVLAEDLVNDNWRYSFVKNIVDVTLAYGFDPEPAGGYLFEIDENSPFLAAAMFPEYPGISYYGISTLADGLWAESVKVDPRTWLEFGDGVSGFLISAFGFNGHPVDIEDAFLFDLKFVSTGALSARLAVLPSVNAAVPEPATWVMMIAGFGVVGLAARRRRAVGMAMAA